MPQRKLGQLETGKRWVANIFEHISTEGTGSVSCNSVFVLYLCRFLNQEELMKRETMIQNP